MLKKHKTLFISDLHLDPQHPLMLQCFLTFLEKNSSDTDALYILGDLFEVWIGDDDVNPFQQSMLQALKNATQKGLRIYFLHGNRDFLIGNDFLTQAGCTLIQEETKIDLYGTPVLLMHGDTLCTQDKSYLKMRKIVRNSFVQTLFLLSPLSLRRWMANKLRALSMKHTSSTAREIMDVTQEEVERVMRNHQVNYLIHGHTHRPAIHQFNDQGKPKERIVLAAWHDQGNVLIWDELGNKELLDFS